MLPTWRGLNPQPPDHQSDAYPTEPPMILVVDSEGPDQTAWIHRLIRAFTVQASPEGTFSHDAAQMKTFLYPINKHIYS